MSLKENSSEELLDKSRAVRPGEELDAARIFAYLSSRIEGLGVVPEIEQFPAGFSNLTYLLRFGDKELVLRRPPAGAKIKTAHDMAREYRILSKLFPVYPKVPRPLLYCEDETIVGAPFYVMERVRGHILRARPAPGLRLSPEVMRALSESFVRTLVEIHSVDFVAAGLTELGRPDGYVARQIEGWTKRYYNSQTDDVPSIDTLARWLAEHAPPAGEGALIHNDYKYDNLVLAPSELSKVVAVLDWEMATVGDASMDFGTALGYWVDRDDSEEWQQYGFGLTTLEGSFSRAELLERYAQLSGREIRRPVFYYAYGLLKIAVIVQQIYRRYRQGFTQDARFANLGLMVEACGEQALRAIEKERIDNLS
ncbi:MAG TPA: phosphotransferase family protein [Pyrinomonadaceae bacterium]|jgi:aminoglycoside phosphotransferase (APT) family kinase protein